MMGVAGRLHPIHPAMIWIRLRSSLWSLPALIVSGRSHSCSLLIELDAVTDVRRFGLYR